MQKLYLTTSQLYDWATYILLPKGLQLSMPSTLPITDNGKPDKSGMHFGINP
jgi:hypothetical protein